MLLFTNSHRTLALPLPMIPLNNSILTEESVGCLIKAYTYRCPFSALMHPQSGAEPPKPPTFVQLEELSRPIRFLCSQCGQLPCLSPTFELLAINDIRILQYKIYLVQPSRRVFFLFAHIVPIGRVTDHG
jgi:hypothetical protein